MPGAACATTFLDSPELFVHEIFRLIKSDFRFAGIRRRIREENVAAVFSGDPTMGGLLARLDRRRTLLHQPGFHDAAFSQ
jgi:hypothetical protein